MESRSDQLSEIGFYTMSDERARSSCATSPLMRAEMILTSRCNFRCPYCRPQRPECRGDMPLATAEETLRIWCKEGLRNVRFSGGEPTLFRGLISLVSVAKEWGCKRIAISTNGSAPIDTYSELLRAGVNDVSASLDACCSETADRMAGRLHVFDAVAANIRWLAERCYVTVGVVVTDANIGELARTIAFADSLGVADIRVIPAAQSGAGLDVGSIPDSILARRPILRYRLAGMDAGRTVRGLTSSDCGTCHLNRDDCIVAGKWHFPCVIHFREGGDPIGEVGPTMREDRFRWLENRDSRQDPICRANCLDVCRDYNNRAEKLRSQRFPGAAPTGDAGAAPDVGAPAMAGGVR